MFLIVVGADQVRDVRPEHVYAHVITRILQFFHSDLTMLQTLL